MFLAFDSVPTLKMSCPLQKVVFVPIDGFDRAVNIKCARGGIQREKFPVLASFSHGRVGLPLWPNVKVIYSIV
jgi:hypothetical protein